MIEVLEEDLIRWPDCQQSKEAKALHQAALDLCTKPTNGPNQDTIDEIIGLDRLGSYGCESAPWLLNYTEDKVQPGTHEEEMVGGYVIFILMTKLPRVQLTCNNYWTLSLEEREEVREAFKQALM